MTINTRPKVQRDRLKAFVLFYFVRQQFVQISSVQTFSLVFGVLWGVFTGSGYVSISQTCGIISWEPGYCPEPPHSVITPAPAVQNRCSSPALAARKSLRQAAILGKLVKTTVAPQVDAATLRCGARRQSGKHRLNLGSAAPRAFVIWRRSSRQVAAVVGCSPCTLSR